MRASPGAWWALGIVAVAGGVHGLFSLYWALGGDWLLDTVGRQMVDAFADRRLLLLPVAAVKIGFALLPVLQASRRRLRRAGVVRVVCWLGAGVLIVWGGLNTLTGNLVLAGVVEPAGGYDRSGMIGHAWLWDPLFLVWGAALAVALFLTRPRTR